MLFALLILLTTYPTTNLFLSLPISAFTNGFWLYFDGYIKCLDFSSTPGSRLALWFHVTLSMYTSRVLNLGKLIFDMLLLYEVTKVVICWLWYSFEWTFYTYQFLLCHSLSNQVTSNHWQAFRLLLVHDLHFTRWQPSWFEASVEWPSSDVFAFLLWISPC